MWFLYLLECRDGSLYTGITVDVEARYAAHASGRGARYTRAHPPARIVLVLPYPDRSTASKAEYALKQLSAPQKRAYVAAQGAAARGAGKKRGARGSAGKAA
ncbi:MAG TPA: GIY-YIG nuclease family protein [Burkholderiales bacterium]|jgi:putative endonuclease